MKIKRFIKEREREIYEKLCKVVVVFFLNRIFWLIKIIEN